MRISVQTILEHLRTGDSHEEILQYYPMLQPEDIEASLEFAVHLMEHKYVVRPIIHAA